MYFAYACFGWIDLQMTMHSLHTQIVEELHLEMNIIISIFIVISLFFFPW